MGPTRRAGIQTFHPRSLDIGTSRVVKVTEGIPLANVQGGDITIELGRPPLLIGGHVDLPARGGQRHPGGSPIDPCWFERLEEEPTGAMISPMPNSVPMDNPTAVATTLRGQILRQHNMVCSVAWVRVVQAGSSIGVVHAGHHGMCVGVRRTPLGEEACRVAKQAENEPSQSKATEAEADYERLADLAELSKLQPIPGTRLTGDAAAQAGQDALRRAEAEEPPDTPRE